MGSCGAFTKTTCWAPLLIEFSLADKIHLFLNPFCFPPHSGMYSHSFKKKKKVIPVHFPTREYSQSLQDNQAASPKARHLESQEFRSVRPHPQQPALSHRIQRYWTEYSWTYASPGPGWTVSGVSKCSGTWGASGQWDTNGSLLVYFQERFYFLIKGERPMSRALPHTQPFLLLMLLWEAVMPRAAATILGPWGARPGDEATAKQKEGKEPGSLTTSLNPCANPRTIMAPHLSSRNHLKSWLFKPLLTSSRKHINWKGFFSLLIKTLLLYKWGNRDTKSLSNKNNVRTKDQS